MFHKKNYKKRETPGFSHYKLWIIMSSTFHYLSLKIKWIKLEGKVVFRKTLKYTRSFN